MFCSSSDFKDEATFTMTSRGHFKLLHGGFEFIKNGINKRGDLTYWHCSTKYKSHCKGKAQTRRIDTREMVRASGVHNHLPSDTNDEI